MSSINYTPLYIDLNTGPALIQEEQDKNHRVKIVEIASVGSVLGLSDSTKNNTPETRTPLPIPIEKREVAVLPNNGESQQAARTSRLTCLISIISAIGLALLRPFKAIAACFVTERTHSNANAYELVPVTQDPEPEITREDLIQTQKKRIEFYKNGLKNPSIDFTIAIFLLLNDISALGDATFQANMNKEREAINRDDSLKANTERLALAQKYLDILKETN